MEEPHRTQDAQRACKFNRSDSNLDGGRYRRRYGAVAAAVATGAMSPEEGQAVARVIEFQRRAIETDDLAARIEALERGAGRP